MDIETLAICKKTLSRADAATAAANAAADEAETAIAAIYHDKNFLLTVENDNSLSLTYNDETEE